MENSLSNININSNSWKIALAIAIPIAIVPKKAIAIAVSILLLMSATNHQGFGFQKASSQVSAVGASPTQMPIYVFLKPSPPVAAT